MYYSVSYQNSFGTNVTLDVRNQLNVVVSGESIKEEVDADFTYPDGKTITFIDISTTELIRRDNCLSVYVDFPPLLEQTAEFETQIKTMIQDNIQCKINCSHYIVMTWGRVDSVI